MNVIIRGLNKNLSGKQVLRDFDMTVEHGQTVSVLGASGMGKSVLLKHIIGFMHADSGSIRVGETEITDKTEKQLRLIRKQTFAMVFQSPALLNSYTIGENILLGLRERGMTDRAKIEAIARDKLRIVGLEGEYDRYPRQLSGGMQKRVGVARALALEPSVMLYDEPTAGLDPITSHEIFKVIRDLKQRFGITSIVVTHDVIGALYISDLVGLLYQGQLVEYAPPEAFSTSTNPRVRQFLAPFEERKAMTDQSLGAHP